MKRRLTIAIFLLITVIGSSFGMSVLADNDQQALFEPPILIVNTSFLNIRTGPSAQFSVLTTVVGGTELPVLGTVGDGVWYQISTANGVGWVNIEYTIARGDFSNVPRVEVTTQPTQTVVVELPETNNNVQVVPQAAPSGTTASDSTAGTVGGANEIIFRAVPNQSIAVYETIAQQSALTTLYSDDRNKDYAIVGQYSMEGMSLLQLDVPSVGQGWVDATKVDLRLARTTERDVMVVTAEVVAMTSAPNAGNNGLLPVVTTGREGYLTGISSDGNFIKIQLGTGEEGWVPFSTVQQRRDTTTDLEPLNVASSMTMQSQSQPDVDMTLGQGGGVEEPKPVVSSPSLQTNAGVVIINTSFLNIRSGPGAQYTSVFTARGGSEMTVLGVASDGVWFLVQGPFGQGWVNNEFVIYRGNIENVPIIRNASGTLSTPIAVIGSSAQLYAAPGTNFGLLGAVAGPVEAPVVARTADFEWVQINTSVGFGWVQSTSVTIRGDVNLIPIINN